MVMSSEFQLTNNNQLVTNLLKQKFKFRFNIADEDLWYAGSADDR